MKDQDVAKKYNPHEGVAGDNGSVQEDGSFVIRGQRQADFMKDRAIAYKMVVFGLF